MSFLIQSAAVWREAELSRGADGLPVVGWTMVEAARACRLMHDMGADAGGNEGGSVTTPRCYLELDSGVLAQDELVVDDVRYRVEQMYPRAEGGTHYDLAKLRSVAQG